MATFIRIAIAGFIIAMGADLYGLQPDFLRTFIATYGNYTYLVVSLIAAWFVTPTAVFHLE